jgi:hypothetical protein
MALHTLHCCVLRKFSLQKISVDCLSVFFQNVQARSCLISRFCCYHNCTVARCTGTVYVAIPLHCYNWFSECGVNQWLFTSCNVIMLSRGKYIFMFSGHGFYRYSPSCMILFCSTSHPVFFYRFGLPMQPDLHVPVLFHESYRNFLPAQISRLLNRAMPSCLTGLGLGLGFDLGLGLG